eukprot:TRINITY_DN3574_c0_g1_i4.p1 TRINITY_DN3574_c0_g1~~TRINITY_DN3574_c0_g1_i4.p1  ORF type:complete len:140 (+),score=40.33 TRINITY_DN3574_c0_g1_i4:243-662(+)
MCFGKIGFVISIVQITEVGPGRILETGNVVFKVSYDAVVFRPFVNEVIDAIVTQIIPESGVMAAAGPLKIFISTHGLPASLVLQDGFIVDSAPADADGVAQPSSKLEVGGDLRLRIIGLKMESQELLAIGTLKGDFLAF